MTNKEKAMELIQAAQDKTETESLLWCIAEDLKAVVQAATEDECAVIATDLEAGSHTLQSCEQCVHDYAGKHRSKGVGVCPPARVPGILREHFGLPEKPTAAVQETEKTETAGMKHLSLMDFWE